MSNALTCGFFPEKMLCGGSDLHVRWTSRSNEDQKGLVRVLSKANVRCRAVPLTCTCGAVRCRAAGTWATSCGVGPTFREGRTAAAPARRTIFKIKNGGQAWH